MSDSSVSDFSDSTSSSDGNQQDTIPFTPTSTSLAAQYPVQVQQQQSKPKQRDRLLPGEKKRLRKEKIKAKRAARGGLEVLAVNERLRAMVIEEVDMEVCLSMGGKVLQQYVAHTPRADLPHITIYTPGVSGKSQCCTCDSSHGKLLWSQRNHTGEWQAQNCYCKTNGTQ